MQRNAFIRSLVAAVGVAELTHVAPALAVPNLRHLELFADHERLEQLLFHGTAPVVDGQLTPSDAPGNGMALAAGAARYRT